MIESDGLEELFATASQFCFKVSVDVGDGEGMRPLSGRQCIGAVPCALWAANATNFNVTSNATVGGLVTTTDLDVTDDARVFDDLRVGGDLLLTSSSGFGSFYASDGKLSVYLDASADDDGDRFQIINNSTNTEDLLFRIDETTGGFIAGDLRVTGELQVDGNHLTNEVSLTRRSGGDFQDNTNTLCNFDDTDDGFDNPTNHFSNDGFCELGSASEYVCFLTRSGIGDISCRVEVQNGVWRLTSNGRDSSGCEARCFAYKRGE